MHENDLLNKLRDEWTTLGYSLASRQTTSRLRDRYPDAPWRDAEALGDVLYRLERGGGLNVEERSELVTILLLEAGDPTVHRALLQTLLPGMISVCRQLQFGRGIIRTPSLVVNEAIGLLADLIRDWAGQRRTYAAPDLMSALRGRLRRWLLREKEFWSRRAGDVPATAVAPETSTLLARLELLAQHDNYARLARLTHERVFAGVPLYQLARAEGTSPTSLQQELQQFAREHLL